MIHQLQVELRLLCLAFYQVSIDGLAAMNDQLAKDLEALLTIARYSSS